MSAALVKAALSLMLAVVPPGRSQIRDARETSEEGRARYEQITRAIVTAADGNKRAVALLLSISLFESGWRRDVDLGIGPLARGDGGASCGLWQIRYGRGPRCDALLADRTEAAREALKLARRSFAKCRSKPPLERLGAYTAGDCAKGAASSRARLEKAEHFVGMLERLMAEP